MSRTSVLRGFVHPAWDPKDKPRVERQVPFRFQVTRGDYFPAAPVHHLRKLQAAGQLSKWDQVLKSFPSQRNPYGGLTSSGSHRVAMTYVE
jgi:hypothetical protein